MTMMAITNGPPVVQGRPGFEPAEAREIPSRACSSGGYRKASKSGKPSMEGQMRHSTAQRRTQLRDRIGDAGRRRETVDLTHEATVQERRRRPGGDDGDDEIATPGEGHARLPVAARG